MAGNCAGFMDVPPGKVRNPTHRRQAMNTANRTELVLQQARLSGGDPPDNRLGIGSGGPRPFSVRRTRAQRWRVPYPLPFTRSSMPDNAA
jgi:hypothetical protein